jgi:hypothetical protein
VVVYLCVGLGFVGASFDVTFVFVDSRARAVVSSARSLAEKLSAMQILTRVTREFMEFAECTAKLLVDDRRAPVPAKTLQPVKVGGIAGGTKYLLKYVLLCVCPSVAFDSGFCGKHASGVSFKFVDAQNGLYSDYYAGAKAASMSTEPLCSTVIFVTCFAARARLGVEGRAVH